MLNESSSDPTNKMIREVLGKYKSKNKKIFWRQGDPTEQQRTRGSWFLTHPNILLLMGVSYTQHYQNLVFEHVQLGSLHARIHLQKKVPTLIVCVDILLQITDALIFIHSRGYIHCALSSHAVQFVIPFLAKLARFEYACREGSS